MKKRQNSYDSSALSTLKSRFNTNLNKSLKSIHGTNEHPIFSSNTHNPLHNKSMKVNENEQFRSSRISHISQQSQLNSLYDIYKDSGFEDKPIAFEDFKEKILGIITYYKLDSSDNKSNNFLALKLENLTLDEKVKIRETLKRITKFKNESKEAAINIAVDFKDYLNPYDSAIILKKNHEINSQIKLEFYDRMKQVYGEEIKRINDVMYNQEHMPKKIKVTNIIHHGPAPETSSPTAAKIKKENVSLPSIIPNGKYKYTDLFGYYIYRSKSFPESREQFTLTYDMFDVVMFGGMVSNKSNLVWSLDPVTMDWKKLSTEGSSNVNLRFGHTSVLFQKKLYVFGGKFKSNSFFFLADLEVFNLEEKTWSTPIVYTKNTLKLRSNHVAELIGQQMFIHGGVSDDNEILGDSYLYSFNSQKWYSCSLEEDSPQPKLAYHTCCLVLPSEQRYNPKLNIYKLTDVRPQKKDKKISHPGLYLFGGKENNEGKISNEIWVLKMGHKPCDWYQPITRGTPPEPRYSHSMNYYEEGNFLIIHGGRNDHSSESSALNDTWILELFTLDWVQIKIYSDSPMDIYKRCGHSSVIYTNKLIIFGGMNNMNYIGSSIFIINLDVNYKPNANSSSLDSKKMGNMIKKDSTQSVSTNAKPNKKYFMRSKSNLFLPEASGDQDQARKSVWVTKMNEMTAETNK